MRVNAISPSWTITGMVPPEIAGKLDAEWQGPDVVARSVAILMADTNRQGQLIYSIGGKFTEIEDSMLLPPVVDFIGENNEDLVIEKLHKMAEGQKVGYT